MRYKFLAHILIAALWALCTSPVDAQATRDSSTGSSEQQLGVLADRIAEQLVARQCGKVTALDFTDIQGRTNELGRYFAEQLSGELFAHAGLTILDRANFASIMKEHQLTAEGLVDNPGDAKKLGQFTGVKAILVGTLTSLDGAIELSVKGISTDTAEWVATGKVTFSTTQAFDRMLGQRSGKHSATPSDDAGPGPATATEHEAIAEREVGPVVITLRSVDKHSIQDGDSPLPAIRCTFGLENRNLQRHVVIAANQRLNEHYGTVPKMAGYRGDILDSSRDKWIIVDAKGIAGVACFEVEESLSLGSKFQFAQRNPGGIVDAVRRGKKFDASTTEYGSFWSGSCGSIPPGGKTQLSVDFAPASRDKHSRPRRSSEKPDLMKWPAYFQFEMELVLGTFAEGEDPQKAKDLVLRSLTIDRVTLPNDADPDPASKHE